PLGAHVRLRLTDSQRRENIGCKHDDRGTKIPTRGEHKRRNRVGAFANMRGAARVGARMAFVCWRALTENPWMEVPMNAVSRHLPTRPKPVPNAPGMFAFADPKRVSDVLITAGWAAPRLEKLDLDLDIAAGRGLEEAVDQSTK